MNWAWAASLDHIWRSPSFPMWVTLAAAVFFAVVLLVTLARAEKSVANGALTVITLLAIGIAVAATIRGFGSGDRSPIEGNAVPQTVAMLPALACLDGLAGESVEAACEKALFASADAVAAAVSHTGRQLSRLTALGDVASAKKAMTPELIAMRRVIERDRYGLVAQVLTAREQCTPTACEAFRSLTDRKQVTANMAEKTYEGFVGRYALAWSNPSVAAAPSATALANVPAPAGKPTSADFPTAASIPPVNIMGSEPSAAALSAARTPPAPPSSPFPPPPQPARQSTAATAAPPPAAAKKQSGTTKQQRTTAPVQLAPASEPDDN